MGKWGDYIRRKSTRNIHKGYGHQSKHYKNKVGNLFININFLNKTNYKIVDYDLYLTLDIHYQDAIDGSDLIHTHLDNKKMRIKIPERTKDNELIRIKNKGLLKNKTQRGDLYFKINVVIDYERVRK